VGDNNTQGAIILTLTGRRKILCDENVITEANVAKVLTDALVIHNQNRSQIDYLYRYYKGDQPILHRTKEIRPEICNRIVENRANEIVSFKTGYLCGEPLQYVSQGSTDNVSAEISKINDMMLLCGKAAKDKELAEWMYVCGTGYRMIMPNSPYINTSIIPRLLQRRVDFAEDEAPFSIYTLDPRNAFVVYHSGLGEPPLMGVKYVVRQDEKIVYSVYTPAQYFELVSDNLISGFRIEKTENRKLSAIPIVEYPLNNARQGAFEVVLPLLDAINTVQSNRLDGIEQFVQSLIVITNGEIPEEKAKFIHEAGLITLKSFAENKASIEIIAEQLDQQQTQTLIDYMHQTILDIVGMPNRNGGNSTSDTGSAVIMRDGWSAAEARAKADELMFKESERQMLKIALAIVRSTVGTTLRLADTEIRFTRRNYENIQEKSQVLTTMLANDKIAPRLAFTHCGMFSDPEDAAKMSAEHYSKVQAELETELSGLV
jgi:SPP1 family phage portal protein